MASSNIPLTATLQALVSRAAGLWRLSACGITRSETAIPTLLHTDAYVPTPSHPRVLLIGALSGQPQDVEIAIQALNTYLDEGEPITTTVALSAIPVANPDAVSGGTAPENGAGGRPDIGYPPLDHFFDDLQNPERRYLWRWTSTLAPDIIVEVCHGPTVSWEMSADIMSLSGTSYPLLAHSTPLMPEDHLLAALGAGNPSGLGPIPSLRLTTPTITLASELSQLWPWLAQIPKPSSARQELNRRRSRSPLAIARQLAEVYGHTLEPIVYTQGMAIDARLQLARIDPETPSPAVAITQLVTPYFSDNAEPLGSEAGAAALGGLIWGPELTHSTGDSRYADMLIRIADRYQSDPAGGAPPPSDPTFRTEDMAMNGMILGRAFELTRQTRYLEHLIPFLLNANIQQPNGLFWHCRTAPYYWGRGNGFAAIGYCETLSYLPIDHPDRQALLDRHLQHLEALRQCQQPSGLYPQVLNKVGSYEEFTVTCMLGYVMARGLRRGWLDMSYQENIDLAWQGVVERIDDHGGIIDACTNTGVQNSLRDYLDRPAIFGHDDRSGAMAMWFALECIRLHRKSVNC